MEVGGGVRVEGRCHFLPFSGQEMPHAAGFTGGNLASWPPAEQKPALITAPRQPSFNAKQPSFSAPQPPEGGGVGLGHRFTLNPGMPRESQMADTAPWPEWGAFNDLLAPFYHTPTPSPTYIPSTHSYPFAQTSQWLLLLPKTHPAPLR